VAVKNSDGTLFSNLSAKDLKEVKVEEMSSFMRKKVLEFVQIVRSKQINVSYPVFSCHLHNTIDQVITKLKVLRVHRLYIVNEHNRPVGVLTIGDICKILN